MDKATLTALKQSIAKWEKNAKARWPSEAELGASKCPLCEMFFRRVKPCSGCPVAASTGRGHCEDTPYDAARRRYRVWGELPSSGARKENFHAAAREEVSFLKALLPIGEDAE